MSYDEPVDTFDSDEALPPGSDRATLDIEVEPAPETARPAFSFGSLFSGGETKTTGTKRGTRAKKLSFEQKTANHAEFLAGVLLTVAGWFLNEETAYLAPDHDEAFGMFLPLARLYERNLGSKLTGGLDENAKDIITFLVCTTTYVMRVANELQIKRQAVLGNRQPASQPDQRSTQPAHDSGRPAHDRPVSQQNGRQGAGGLDQLLALHSQSVATGGVPFTG